MNNRDLTISELATLCGVHRETVWRNVRAGRIPGAYRVGKQWRVAHEAVERLRKGGAK